MIFDTRVNNIPCQCKVLEYSPYVPLRVYGPDINEATPPEGETFDCIILDRRGRKAPWLEKYLTPADSDRLLEEFLLTRRAEEYGFY